jgi:hypothetical protein
LGCQRSRNSTPRAVWGQDPLNLRLRHESGSARRSINE